MISQKIIQENKEKLEAEETRLRSILSKRGEKESLGEFPRESKPNFHTYGEDEGENANEVEAFGVNLGITNDMETKLMAVVAALKRIEAGTYGKCKEGDDIEEERLGAIPEAETCMKHAQS